MLIKTSDHMQASRYTDSRTQKEEIYYEYVGPSSWAEEATPDTDGDRGPVMLCAFIWDDMWLVPREIRHMMAEIEKLEEARTRGAAWQHMRVVFREDVQHYVMEVPAYRTKEETEKYLADLKSRL